MQLDQNIYTKGNENEMDPSSTGNFFNQNAKFVDTLNAAGADSVFLTPDDGLRLLSGSPCIDKGVSGADIPLADIMNNARIGQTDIGAYEAIPDPNQDTLYVDESVASSGNGKSWIGAFKSMDEAVTEAYNYKNVNTIKVAAGTYTPSIGPVGSGVLTMKTFHFRGGLQILGGYPQGGSNQRDPRKNQTILSGSKGPVCLFADSAGKVQNSVLDGFTITEGSSNPVAFSLHKRDIAEGDGGGVHVVGTNVHVRNVYFTDNRAGTGAAVFSNWSYGLTLENCFFYKNSAFKSGGAVQSFRSKIKFVNNLFAENTGGLGSAIYAERCDEEVYNNTFAKNVSPIPPAQLPLVSDLFSLNAFSRIYYNNVFFRGSGLADMQAMQFGIVVGQNTFKNNLFYRSTTALGLGADTAGNRSDMAIDFLDTTNTMGADGQPFTYDDGYSLKATSPCINTGFSYKPGDAYDIIGRLRMNGLDIGAYEYSTFGVGMKPMNPTDLQAIVYPNPSVDGRFILAVNQSPGRAVLEVFGADGKLVYTGTLNNELNKQIDLSGMAKGVYYVRLSSEEYQQVCKLIIE